MSQFKNWCALVSPALGLLLVACGSPSGDLPDATRVAADGSGVSVASTPSVGGSLPTNTGSVLSAPFGAPGSVGAPQCVTANPQNCNLAKSQEQPPAPPPSLKLTGCTIQVLLESVTALSGQGATEGDLEMSVLASSGGDSLRWPETCETPMAVGNTKQIEEVVAEYQLAPRELKKIDVCATFTEDDDNGVNGSSDVGSDCDTVEISCKLAQTGSLPVNLSAPLCMGNKLDSQGNCKNLNGSASADFRVAVSDEDWDNIPNDEDATPLPEDEACRGQEGRGVVLFMDFGSSDLNDLVGALGVGVDELTDDYDFVAIATDPLDVAGFTLRQDTLANADMVVPPTFEGLLDAFRVTTSKGFDITFYDLSHGGADAFGEAFFSSADPSGLISESSLDVALSPEVSGTCAYPFRAVTSLACYFGMMNQMWLDHGAKAVGAPEKTNYYPQEINGFGRHWNNAETFLQSEMGAFDPIVRSLNKFAIEAVGVAYAPGMNCFSSVLGLNPCAEEFFTTGGPASMSLAGNGRNDYVSTLSGADNMDLSSTHLINGNTAITKFSGLTW